MVATHRRLLYLLEGCVGSRSWRLPRWNRLRPFGLRRRSARLIRSLSADALIAGLPGVLTWVLLGAMMLVWSRTPEKAGVLVVIVAASELLVWLPVDVIGLLNGFEVPRAVMLMTIHLVIGVSGLLLLRGARRSTDRAIASR